MADRLTAEQVHSATAAVIQGFDLADFERGHSDWPLDDLREFWSRLRADIDAHPLPPGAYWDTGSEW